MNQTMQSRRSESSAPWKEELDLAFAREFAHSEQPAEAGGTTPSEPWIIDHGETATLCVPLTAWEATGHATAAIGAEEAPLAIELARSLVRNRQMHGQLGRLSTESESFAVQVSRDFEELTFLRSLANSLRMTSANADLGSLIESTLRHLIPVLDVESMAVLLVPRKHQGAERDAFPERPRVWWHGEPLMSDIDTLGLAEWMTSSGANPSLCNQPDKLPSSSRDAGVRQAIAAVVGDAGAPLGWLIALNKCADSAGALAVDSFGVSAVFGSGEATLLESAASVLAAFASNVELLKEKETLLVEVVRTLVAAIEAKDPYTCGHSERVALYAQCLADQMGFNVDFTDDLYLSGLLHDVGKIGVPDAALKKTSGLTNSEFDLIKAHPDSGWAILCDLSALHYVLPGVLYHHERFDGLGYPDGLRGAAIPIEGRILSVADAYDAMTSDRPYRRGMPDKKAMQVLIDGAGTQWDPEVIQAFIQSQSRISRIRETYRPTPPKKRVGATAVSTNSWSDPQPTSAE